MPRPRFAKLAPERRAQLLAVATEEFAEHGYEASSFNRIIERSGLSKGSIYYYFDDKEDLYATVLRDAMQRLIDVGDMQSAQDAAGFWLEFEAWYVRAFRLLQQQPGAVGLARSFVKAASRGVAGGALAELRRLGRSWLDSFITQGQTLGAVRTDLPIELLTTVLMGLEEAIDLWLGARVGDMKPQKMKSTAALLTRLYRDVAEPRPGAVERPKKTPTKTNSKPKTSQTKTARAKAVQTKDRRR